MRSWVPVVLFAVSGCATFPDAHLVSLRARLAVQRADTSCGPVAFRRAALGARWGEYLRVTVSAPGPLSGEARLYVDRRPGPPVRFDTSPWTMSQPTPEGAPLPSWPAWSALPETPLLASAQQAVVVDVAWPNEQLDVDSALPKGAPLELSVGGLASTTGRCDGVTFSVEQGVLQPTIGEGAWVAELTRRAGPEWQAKLDAEARRKDEIRRAHVALVDARHAAERATLAERTALAAELRQRHYAQWAQRREARFAVEAEVQVASALDVTAGGGVQLDSGSQRNDVVAASADVQLDSGSQRNDVAASADVQLAFGAQRNDGAAWGGGWTVDPACGGATCGVLRASGNAGVAWNGGAAANGACSSATCGVLLAQGNGAAWTGGATCGGSSAPDVAWAGGSSCAPLDEAGPGPTGEVFTAGGSWAGDTTVAGGTAGAVSASGEVVIAGGDWASLTAVPGGTEGTDGMTGDSWAADATRSGGAAGALNTSGEVVIAGGDGAANTACSAGATGPSISGELVTTGGGWAVNTACSAAATGPSISGELVTTGGGWAVNTACSGRTAGVSTSGEVATTGESWTTTTACSEGTTGVAAASGEVITAGGASAADTTSADAVASASVDGAVVLDGAIGAANLALDASWLASWPSASANVVTESEGWALPSGFERVAVSTTTELVQPPLVDANVTVEAAATVSAVEPFLGFVSAVLTGLVQAAPPPPAQPVHRAAPARR